MKCDSKHKRGVRGRRKKSIPVILQDSDRDCGAACLAMVLRHMGVEVSLHEIIGHLKMNRLGTNAAAIIEAAKRYGVEGAGVRISAMQLRQLAPGAILHLTPRHFVVLQSCSKDSVEILDPKIGRVRVKRDDFGRVFNDVALIFTKQQ